MWIATVSCSFRSSCYGKVMLRATANAGYVFVGWIGCKSTGATTCEVDVTAASEVTAVFLKEGKWGSGFRALT